MSALNVFVERDRAHLITDGAHYDLAGVVQQVGSKVVRSDELGVVLGYSGRTNPSAIVAELRHLGPASAQQLLHVLPALAAGLKRVNTQAHPGDEASGDNDVQMVMLCHELVPNRARAFMVSTNSAWMGSSFPVLQVVEVDHVVTPQVELAASFDPARDGRKLLEAQRRAPFALKGGDQWCVGGFGERHTVSAAGLDHAELVRWPDVVGRKVGEPA